MHTIDQSWLLSLPNELLLQIFSYLSPQDLLNMSQTHPQLQFPSLDGSLWTHVHPIRWATGRWRFFQPPDISDRVREADQKVCFESCCFSYAQWLI